MITNRRAITRTALAIVVVVIIVLAGVGVGVYSYFQQQSSASSLTTAMTSTGLPQALTVDLKGSPDTLDPAMSFSGEGDEINGNVFLAPFYFANSTAKFFPITARSWTASPDGCSYTFNWRNDVYYSNGDPFNAYVVWWNIYRALYTQLGSAAQVSLTLKPAGVGGDTVTLGDVNSLNNPTNTPNNTLLSIMQNQNNAVVILNSTATTLNLSSPCFASNFLGLMAIGGIFFFMDPYFVEQHGGVFAGAANPYFTVHGSDVGDGPYVVQTYVPDEYAILVANPHYWAQNLSPSDPGYNYFTRPARIPEVVLNFKTDELTRALDIGSNRVQEAVIQFPDVKNVLEGDKNLYIPNWGPGGTMEFIGLDSLRPPLNNVLVRRAIIDAINLTAIQDSVYNGYAEPVVGPAMHGFFGYNESSPVFAPPTYNPTEAKQLLAEAGYPNGVGLRPLNFLVVSGSYLLRAGQLIAAQLAEVGITINMQVATEASQIAIAQSCCGNVTGYPDIQAAGFAYYPDMFAPASIIDMRFGAWFFFDNATIDNLIDEYIYSSNQTLRYQLVTEITMLVKQQAPVIWLAQDIDLPQTGNGVGPVVLNKCLVSDFVGNPYYWVFNGIPYTSVSWVCSPS